MLEEAEYKTPPALEKRIQEVEEHIFILACFCVGIAGGCYSFVAFLGFFALSLIGGQIGVSMSQTQNPMWPPWTEGEALGRAGSNEKYHC